MDKIGVKGGQPEFGLLDVGKFYCHSADIEGDSRIEPLPPHKSLRLVDDRILNYIFDFLPSVKNFLSNQEEITAYPLDFVKSERYTTPLKVFHMTFGTIVAGLSQAAYFTVKLVSTVVISIFLYGLSIFETDMRKTLGRDAEKTLKKEVPYFFHGLVKGILQIVPGAGIFLPQVYNGLKNALTSRICDLVGYKMPAPHRALDEDLNEGQETKKPSKRAKPWTAKDAEILKWVAQVPTTVSV